METEKKKKKKKRRKVERKPHQQPFNEPEEVNLELRCLKQTDASQIFQCLPVDKDAAPLLVKDHHHHHHHHHHHRNHRVHAVVKTSEC